MDEARHELAAQALCVACGTRRRQEAGLCTPCGRSLHELEPIFGGGPAGLDRAWSSAPYEGVARDLVGALRFRRLLPAVTLMAERIEWLAPSHMLSGTIVPVPPARSMTGGQSFDPTAELAAVLADRIDAPVEQCLERLPADPAGIARPLLRATAAVPRNVFLLDVVLDTEAIMKLCARGLRAAGASRVVAVTFARRLTSATA